MHYLFYRHYRQHAKERRLIFQSPESVPSHDSKPETHEKTLQSRVEDTANHLKKTVSSDQMRSIVNMVQDMSPEKVKLMNTLLENPDLIQSFSYLVSQTAMSNGSAFRATDAEVRNRAYGSSNKNIKNRSKQKQAPEQIPRIANRRVILWRALATMMDTDKETSEKAAAELRESQYNNLTLDQFVEENPEHSAVDAIRSVRNDIQSAQETLERRAKKTEKNVRVPEIMQAGAPKTVREFIKFVELTAATPKKSPEKPQVNPDRLRAELKELYTLREKLNHSMIEIDMMEEFDSEMLQLIQPNSGFGTQEQLESPGTGFANMTPRARQLIQQEAAKVGRQIAVREQKLKSMDEPFDRADLEASSATFGLTDSDNNNSERTTTKYPDNVTPMPKDSLLPRERSSKTEAKTEIGRLAERIKKMIIPGRYKKKYTPPEKAVRYKGEYDIEAARNLDNVLQLIPISKSTKHNFYAFMQPLLASLSSGKTLTIVQITGDPEFANFRQSIMRDVGKALQGMKNASKKRYIRNAIQAQLSAEDPRKLMNFIWRLQDTWTGADDSPSNKAWEQDLDLKRKQGYAVTNPYPETPHYRYVVKKDLSHIAPGRRALAARYLNTYTGTSLPESQSAYQQSSSSQPRTAAMFNVPDSGPRTEVAGQNMNAAIEKRRFRVTSDPYKSPLSVRIPEEYIPVPGMSPLIRLNNPRAWSTNGMWARGEDEMIAKEAGVIAKVVSTSGGRPVGVELGFTKPGVFAANGEVIGVGNNQQAKVEHLKARLDPKNAQKSVDVSFGKYKPRTILLTLPGGKKTEISPDAANRPGDLAYGDGDVVLERKSGHNYAYTMHFFKGGQYAYTGFFDRGGGRAFGGSVDVPQAAPRTGSDITPPEASEPTQEYLEADSDERDERKEDLDSA